MGILPELQQLDDWKVKNTVNISGSNIIDFDTTLGIVADPPPTVNGINSGEELLISFVEVLDLNYFLRSLNNGDVRLAVHVQSIGDSLHSSSYVNVAIAPEPNSCLLVALGGMFVLLRRKRCI